MKIPFPFECDQSINYGVFGPSINQRRSTSTTIAMAEADVKLTTVSKGGAKLGSVIPQEAMSKSDGKVLLPGNFLGVGEFKTS